MQLLYPGSKKSCVNFGCKALSVSGKMSKFTSKQLGLTEDFCSLQENQTQKHVLTGDRSFVKFTKLSSQDMFLLQENNAVKYQTSITFGSIFSTKKLPPHLGDGPLLVRNGVITLPKWPSKWVFLGVISPL